MRAAAQQLQATRFEHGGDSQTRYAATAKIGTSILLWAHKMASCVSNVDSSERSTARTMMEESAGFATAPALKPLGGDA